MAVASGIALGVGALASVAGGVMKDKAQKKANRANEERYQATLARLREQRVETAGLYGAADKAHRRGIKETRLGFDKARREIDYATAGIGEGVRNNAKRGAGAGMQNLISRGMTSQSGQLQRGIASDATRNMAAVQQSAAGARSTIEARKGAALGGMAQELASLYERRARAMGALTGAQTDIMASKQDLAPSGNWMSSLGQIGLGIGGMGIGQNGLFGGGSGASQSAGSGTYYPPTQFGGG